MVDDKGLSKDPSSPPPPQKKILVDRCEQAKSLSLSSQLFFYDSL